eukprot:10064936-Alexandrium_andersonii.AAC.1
MSASLVGSEMCIRDSLWAPQAVSTRAASTSSRSRCSSVPRAWEASSSLLTIWERRTAWEASRRS